LDFSTLYFSSLDLGGGGGSRPFEPSPLCVGKEWYELAIEGQFKGRVWFSWLHAALKIVPGCRKPVHPLAEVWCASTKHLRHLPVSELPTHFALSAALNSLTYTATGFPWGWSCFLGCCDDWRFCGFKPRLPHNVPPVKIFLLRTDLVRVLRIPSSILSSVRVRVRLGSVKLQRPAEELCLGTPVAVRVVWISSCHFPIGFSPQE